MRYCGLQEYILTVGKNVFAQMTKQGIFGKNDDFGTAIIGLTWSGLLAGVNSLKRLVRTTVAG